MNAIDAVHHFHVVAAGRERSRQTLNMDRISTEMEGRVKGRDHTKTHHVLTHNHATGATRD